MKTEECKMMFVSSLRHGEEVVIRISKEDGLQDKVVSVHDGMCFMVLYLCQVGTRNGQILFLSERKS